MKLIPIFAAIVTLTACGTQLSQSKKGNTPAVTEDAAKAQASKLPAVVMVRVPVDANGKEVHQKAEMRLSNETNVSTSNVESNFSSAKAPEATVDELDGATSTESFHGYYGYRSCGYNNYYGYNYNWSFYRPAYYYGGYYYNWNYVSTYNYGGYNYYQYNSSYGSSYNGYGRAPGYGYGY